MISELFDNLDCHNLGRYTPIAKRTSRTKMVHKTSWKGGKKNVPIIFLLCDLKERSDWNLIMLYILQLDDNFEHEYIYWVNKAIKLILIFNVIYFYLYVMNLVHYIIQQNLIIAWHCYTYTLIHIFLFFYIIFVMIGVT